VLWISKSGPLVFLIIIFFRKQIDMNAGDEIITIVDADNTVVGSATRHEMRAKGLPHRATYILVFNSKGEVFVQKRTMTKDIYPGYYDVATGGVVLADESYDLSAERELAEELGAQNTPLIPHFDFKHEDDNNIVWGRLYTCTYDGKITLQEEEVESGEFLTIDEVLKLCKKEPFTPDGLYALKRYLKLK
jgi:isopentenyldiphosphate isomerase